MAARLRPIALALTVAFALPLAPGARAEDATEAPPPEAPPEEGTKPAKVETDDTSIFKDWGLVKRKGIAHAKTRAEFWAGKGVTGKDLNWLGRMYERGELYAKAIEALQGFIDWTPAAGDTAAAEGKEKNLPGVMETKIIAHLKSRDWEGAIKASDAFLTKLEGSNITGKVLRYRGRAHRMAGDDAKALESFQKSVDTKDEKGLLELVDVHLCNGDAAAAKAAIAKFGIEESKAKHVLELLAAFVDAVGTPAPSLEKGVSVGPTEAAKEWSKPTVLVLWGMQTAYFDRKLQRLEDFRRSFSDKVNAVGVSKYQKYNPQTMKVEEGMTPEQEQEWYRKLALDSPVRLPPLLVLPNEFFEAIKLRFEGHMVLVDGEGKLRYVRMSNVEDYGYDALGLAVKKLVGP
jgi:tetratricopeptide (TPR) repeat protein